MRSLNAYIKRQNEWAAFAGKPLFEINTHEGRQRVAHSIDIDLSPENLSCDGELPMHEVDARYRRLTSAARDLLKIDPTVVIHEYSE